MKRALNQVNYEMLVGLCPEIMTSDEGGWLVLTIADTQIDINVITVTDDARELSLECLETYDGLTSGYALDERFNESR